MDWRVVVGEVTVGVIVGFGLLIFNRANIEAFRLTENFPLNSKILTQFSLGLTTFLIVGGFLFFLIIFSQPYFPLNWIVPFFAALLGLSPLLKLELKKQARKETKTTEAAKMSSKKKEG